MQWIVAHQIYAYLILFLGSYFETLIITSPLIYGEIVFIAGAILAGMGYLHLWEAMLALYAGGLLGDSTSYWIGRRFGHRVFYFLNKRPLLGKFFTEKNYDRGERYFNKYGGASVFLARLAGPVSWVMPFIAGTFRLAYGQFLKFNIPGVIVGVSQFILIGYLFGKGYQIAGEFLRFYTAIILIAAFVGVSLFFHFQRKKKNKC